MFNHSFFLSSFYAQHYFPPVEVVEPPAPSPVPYVSYAVPQKTVHYIKTSLSIALKTLLGVKTEQILSTNTALKTTFALTDEVIDPNAVARKLNNSRILALHNVILELDNINN